MPSKRRCPTCGSRQWHKEPSSGLIACSEGHVLQNYRSEVTDADELGPHALRKRTLKSAREKKGRPSRANPQLYHGARGRYHYFECLQLLLRKQIVVLVREWKLPPEFEIICRDVWALHLALLPTPPPGEHDYMQDDIQAMDVNKDVSGGDNNGSQELEGDTLGEAGDGMIQDDDEPEGDAEIEALLDENSELEESSEEDEDEQVEKVKEGPKRGKRHGLGVYEKPASTIAVLVVACWTMRIPVLYRDFTRLIERYELPYLDPVARQLLPRDMMLHLSKHNMQALSPYHVPTTEVLHGLASRLSRLMYRSYRIFTPEANVAPMLWRVVSQGLCGTPVLYRMTKRVGRIMSLPLTLHDTLSPRLGKLKSHDPERHTYDNVPPEVALISTGIIVLKMVYGLDGRPRVPRKDDDAACGLPEVGEYLARLTRMEGADGKGMFDARRNDVRMEELNEEEMDAYLGFGEQALVGEASGDPLLERYFPLRKKGAERSGELKTHPGGLPAVTADPASRELRPGEGYRVYRAQDVCGTVDAAYDAVVGHAARWVGLSEEHLAVVVERYERRLMRDKNRRGVTV